jgi:hypothetical protein
LWQPKVSEEKVEAFSEKTKQDRHAPFKRTTERSATMIQIVSNFDKWLRADYVTINSIVLAEETKSKFISQLSKVFDWLEVRAHF